MPTHPTRPRLSPSCPGCHAVAHLLQIAETEVVRHAIPALARGPGWGVLVAPPDELRSETPEEQAALEAARTGSGIYVGPSRVEALLQMVPTEGHPRALLAGMRAQLEALPPEGQVHVLAGVSGCVAIVTVRADPAILAILEREEAIADRIPALFGLAEPEVLRRAPEALGAVQVLFMVAEHGSEVAAALGGDPAGEAAGVYVGLHPMADVIAALPLDRLEPEHAVRALGCFTAPLGAGEVRVALAHEGHLVVVSALPEPGFLPSIRRK